MTKKAPAMAGVAPAAVPAGYASIHGGPLMSSGSEEKPRRILVVEDDLSILTGVSMNLRFEGYEVLQAQDGRTG